MVAGSIKNPSTVEAQNKVSRFFHFQWLALLKMMVLP